MLALFMVLGLVIGGLGVLDLRRGRRSADNVAGVRTLAALGAAGLAALAVVAATIGAWGAAAVAIGVATMLGRELVRREPDLAREGRVVWLHEPEVEREAPTSMAA